MSAPPDSERLVAAVHLLNDGDFVHVQTVFGRVRVQMDGETLVAVIETPQGCHVVSTFADAAEIRRIDGSPSP